MHDFSGFTPRAQKVVQILAQQEARRLFSDELTPEHIFLGLLRESDGVGIRAMILLGLDVDDLRREVESTLKSRSGNTLTLGGIPISERVHTVLSKSRYESQLIGHNYVGTEHILLGILMEEDVEAILPFMIENRGFTVDEIRQAIVKTLGYGKAEGISSEKRNTHIPNLEKFGKNLTRLAAEDQLDPVIGRKKEISRVIQVLCRRQKNNPILIGEPGVGKTAIVEGIAQLIELGQVPEKLIKRQIFLLDMALLVSGTKYRGEFEERIKNIINEVESNENVILFIDEIHTIIGAGNAEGALDASNMLKPSLARGKIRCIGATTFDEYKKRIEKDKALVRRFQSIVVDEPSIEETIAILQRLKTKYEQFHHVIYTNQALVAAVQLSYRYLNDRHLPDKAIDLLDESGADAVTRISQKPASLLRIEKELMKLENEKKSVVQGQNYEQAARLRDHIREVTQQRQKAKQKWMETIKKRVTQIDQKDIERVIARMTNIPTTRIHGGMGHKNYRSIEIELSKNVMGQKEAVRLVSQSIKKSMVGLRDIKHPISNFIFLGPTGVGKTELAKTLAQFIFGSEEALIRVDMSEYMEKFNVSRLVGAPPGYIGYESGGELTEKVRRKPYSVILFDEIEKANPDIFNLFLQILDEGRIKDSLGNMVDFRNTIIIFTSNIGTEFLTNRSTLGFSDDDSLEDSRQEYVLGELTKRLNPEFLNRIDEVIVFEPLNEKVLVQIVGKLVGELNTGLESQGMKLFVSEGVKKLLISKGFEKKYGARSLKRAMSRLIEVPVSEKILEEQLYFDPENTLLEMHCTLKSGKIDIKIKLKEQKVQEPGIKETKISHPTNLLVP